MCRSSVRHCTHVLMATVFCLLAGCTDNVHLTAAKAIDDPAMQQDAIISVAVRAANEGDGPLTRKALAEITDVGKRDRAAAACARALAHRGRYEEALEMTRQIIDVSLRNEMLAELAKKTVKERDD